MYVEKKDSKPCPRWNEGVAFGILETLCLFGSRVLTKWVYVMTLWRLSVCVCVCVCMYVTNFNIGNISDTIYSNVLKVGQRVACGETFKMIWHWVTLTSGQGHSIYWKFKKKPYLTIFDNISDTIHSTLMRRSQKVALGQIFKTMCHWVTLTKGQSHSLYFNARKCQFFYHIWQSLRHYILSVAKLWKFAFR